MTTVVTSTVASKRVVVIDSHHIPHSLFLPRSPSLTPATGARLCVSTGQKTFAWFVVWQGSHTKKETGRRPATPTRGSGSV